MSDSNTATLEQVAPVASTPNVVAPPQLDTNSFLVPIDRIDCTTFTNYRKEMTDAAVQTLQDSFKAMGQMQGINCSPLANGLMAVYAGFTRYEAKCRDVCAPLIKKYNNDLGYDSTHPARKLVSNPQHRREAINAYPEEFLKEKSKPHNLVKVSIDAEVKTAGQAKLRNVAENFHRTSISPMDFMDAIEDMIVNEGMAAKEVATKLSSTSNISQNRRARKVPDVLRKILVIPEKFETISETALVKLKEDVDLMLAELVRRLRMLPSRDKANPAIPFAVIRLVSEQVVFDEGKELPILREHALELLCRMTGAAVNTRKIDADKPCDSFTLLQQYIATFKNTAKAKREGKAVPETAGAASTENVEGAATGTVEGLAASQAAKKTEGPTITNVKDDANAISSGKEATPKASDEASEANADAKVATPATTASNTVKEEKDSSNKTMAELVGADPEALDAMDDDVTEDDSPLGEKRAKVQNAPLSLAKSKEPNVILSAVETFLSAIKSFNTEQDKSSVLTGAYLMTASFGYEMVSMNDKHQKFNAAAVDYCEKLELYLMELEEHVKKANELKNKKLGLCEIERPLIPDELFADVTGDLDGVTDDDVDGDDAELEDNIEEGSDVVDDLEDFDPEGVDELLANEGSDE